MPTEASNAADFFISTVTPTVDEFLNDTYDATYAFASGEINML